MTYRSNLDELRESLENHSEFALDLETSGLDFIRDRIVIVSITTDDGTWAIPTYGPSSIPFVQLVDTIEPALSNPEKTMHTWGGKFDLNFLSKNGVIVQCKHFDGMLALYILNSQLSRKRGSYSLEHNAKKYLDIELKKSVRNEFVGIHKIESYHLQYGAEDADATFKLNKFLEQELEKRDGLIHVFKDMTMRLLPVLSNMECAGVYLDVEYLQELEEKLTEQADKKRQQIKTELNIDNPNSRQQLSTALFSPNGILQPLKNHPKTKTKHYSTSEHWLSKYKHPILDIIGEHTTMTKLVSTFVTPLIKAALDDPEGRIHTNLTSISQIPGVYPV